MSLTPLVRLRNEIQALTIWNFSLCPNSQLTAHPVPVLPEDTPIQTSRWLIDPDVSVQCDGCHRQSLIAIDEDEGELAVRVRGPLALQISDWVLSEHGNKPTISSDPRKGHCSCCAGNRKGRRRDSPEFNRCKAMRVLEDYLCLEILQDATKALACYSLKALQNDPQHKEAFDKVMTEHGLTPYHLEVLNRTKNISMDSINPHDQWKNLVAKTVADEPDCEARSALTHLFDLLASFFPEATAMNVLRSPVHNDKHDERFHGRIATQP